MIGHWNSEEDEALQYLPLRAQVIYLRGIRRYADANGIAGIKRRISWKSLSEVAEVLPERGSHNRIDSPTRKAVRCAIEQLEKAELIKQLPDSERFKGLVFKCLMAGQDKSVQMRRGQGGAKEGPCEEGPRENPDAMRDSGAGGAKEGPRKNHPKQGEEGPASPSPNTTNTPHTHARAKKPLPEDWQPSDRCYELIEKAEIPRSFADQCIDEFVLYWSESQEKRASWDATFLNRVKDRWARAKENPANVQGRPGSSNTTTRGSHHETNRRANQSAVSRQEEAARQYRERRQAEGAYDESKGVVIEGQFIRAKG